MNLNKKSEISENFIQSQKQTQLPIIKKIPAARKILHRSNSYLTPNLYGNNFKNYFAKNARVISYGSQGIDIHTKFYRINDYLSRTNKDINLLQTTNTFLRNKSTNENTELKKKNEIQSFNADIGMTSSNYFPKKKSENVSTNSARMLDSLKLNRQNKVKYLISESLDLLEGKLENNNNNNENKTKTFVFKKLNNYNTKLLKNSRYFSNTKYINGPKNKNKHLSKTCSTKNISFANTSLASTFKKTTMNDVRVEELLLKQKNLEENEKKNNFENNKKKMSDIATETDNENIVPNPIFYDFIPIILQHLKRKEIEEETNKENEWIYNKINSIYNKDSNRQNKYTTLKSNNNTFLFENPIIRYLFLEKTLYNIKHSVKFIDAKNKEQIVQNVLKIIKDEYTSLKEKKYKFNIHDFITYGYEFDPKLLIKFQQSFKKSSDLHNYLQKVDKGVQKNISTKLSIPSNKDVFFATNKSENKINNKKIKSKNDKSKDEKSGSEGILSRIFKNQNVSNKIRRFEGLKIREREKDKDKERTTIEIDSNKQNISKLIFKDSAFNYSSEKYKDENKDENNFNYLTNSDFHIKNINALNNLESEKSEKNSSINADIFPHPIFQNDKLREAQPTIPINIPTNNQTNIPTKPIIPNIQQSSIFASLRKTLMDIDNKRLSLLHQKENEKKPEINKPSLYFAKENIINSSNQTKENIKHIINKPKFRRFSIKRSKKKKKTNNDKNTEDSNENDNNNKNNTQLDTIKEIKNDNSAKREIKDINEYEEYKKEMIEKNKMDKKIKENLIKEIKKEEERQSAILNPDSIVNELKYSTRYKRMKTSNSSLGKKFRKFEKDDFFRMGEKKQFTQLKKLKEEKSEEKEIEEKEEDIFEDEDDFYYNEDDYSDSIYSSEFNDLKDLDFSKEFENKGEIMDKKWIDNSPKFKSRIIGFIRKKRGVIDSLSDSSDENLEGISKNEKISKLSDKMKLLYDKLKNRRKARKKKKKKSNYYNFAGVDLKNIDEIEKKKQLYLIQLKEDVKYKIKEGKYHLIEIENFKNFENAMNKFRLKDTSNEKKVKLYLNLVERYLRFYQMELDNKEKEKNDEDRINKFLRDLNQDVYGTFPLVKEIKGRYCHSIDYFQELYQLSEIHGFLM